ncbi:hypothetical protein FIBSPDRAFT_1051268 [Athelia psychrophila]|uniref:Uncharacterized protein n=1 Tax=Athelia psychrophila TaxID=1759441 RepID=A0A165ZFS3_9AGAM|nr:hypothetical protein FIBSPDRAFT_1051268 [Fibularhizoctonia sp. CBS 109695]
MTSPASSSRKPFEKPRFFDRVGQDGWFCNVCTLSHEGCQPPMTTSAAMAHERDSSEHAHNASAVEMWNAQPNDAWGAVPEVDRPTTYDELRARTQRSEFDQVRDMVPFWQKGVEAAERGEVLRLEEFLDKLAAEDRWGVADINDPWGPSVGPWPTERVPEALANAWEEPAADGWGQNGGNAWAEGVHGGWGEPAQDGWGKADDWGTWNEGGCAKPKHQWDKVAGWAADEESTLSAQASRASPRQSSPHKSGRKIKKGQKALGDPHSFVEEIARQQDVDVERKRRMHDFCEMPTQDKVKKIEEMVRSLRA